MGTENLTYLGVVIQRGQTTLQGGCAQVNHPAAQGPT